jgi:hypothetical protein
MFLSNPVKERPRVDSGEDGGGGAYDELTAPAVMLKEQKPRRCSSAPTFHRPTLPHASTTQLPSIFGLHRVTSASEPADAGSSASVGPPASPRGVLSAPRPTIKPLAIPEAFKKATICPRPADEAAHSDDASLISTPSMSPSMTPSCCATSGMPSCAPMRAQASAKDLVPTKEML